MGSHHELLVLGVPTVLHACGDGGAQAATASTAGRAAPPPRLGPPQPRLSCCCLTTRNQQLARGKGLCRGGGAKGGSRRHLPPFPSCSREEAASAREASEPAPPLRPVPARASLQAPPRPFGLSGCLPRAPRLAARTPFSLPSQGRPAATAAHWTAALPALLASCICARRLSLSISRAAAGCLVLPWALRASWLWLVSPACPLTEEIQGWPFAQAASPGGAGEH